MSKYLSQTELRGLSRLGDIVVPGGYGQPSFSQTGCVSHIDELMAATPPADVKDFKLLMKAFSIAPVFVIRGILKLVDKNNRFPEPIAGLLRLLSIGIKGVVFSLYYSNKTREFYQGPSVHESIGYHVHCEPISSEELKGSTGQ